MRNERTIIILHVIIKNYSAQSKLKSQHSTEMALCVLMCRYTTQSLNTQTQTETALRELLQQAARDDIGTVKNEHPRLTNGEIIFEELQPTSLQYRNVAEGRTDRQKDRRLAVAIK